MADITIYSSDTSFGSNKYQKFGTLGSLSLKRINIDSDFTGVGDYVSSSSITSISGTYNLPLLFYVQPAQYVNGELQDGRIYSAVSGLFDKITSGTKTLVYTDGSRLTSYYIKTLYTYSNISICIATSILDEWGTIGLLFNNGDDTDTLYLIYDQSSVLDRVSLTDVNFNNFGYIPLICGYYSTKLSSYLSFSPFSRGNLFYNVGPLVVTDISSQVTLGYVPSMGSFGSCNVTFTDYSSASPIGATVVANPPSMTQLFDESTMSDNVIPGEGTAPQENAPDVSDNYGGGKGDFDYTSDTISDPEPIDVEYNHIAVAGVWVPTDEQLQSIFKKLWSSDVIASLIGIFGNNQLLDGIMAFKYYPFTVESSGTATMALGTVSTGVTVNVAKTQHVTITYNGSVKHFTDDYYDYSPYTNIKIHLPFIGIVPLDTNTVMGKNIKVQYIIDISSGGCLCCIYVQTDDNYRVFYVYQTTIGLNIPVSAIDSRQLGQTLSSMALSAITGALGVADGLLPKTPMSDYAIMSNAVSVSSSLTNAKTPLQQSGSLGSNPAMEDSFDVYLIYTCPHVSYPEKDDSSIHGRQSSGVITLSDISGYAEIILVNPAIDGADSEEMQLIENELKGGVIL